MKLMVIDGNSIINRAYYGIRPLTTKDGLYTHAVYGFLSTLQRLLDEEAPEGLCVAFDLRAPTFRHREYEGYKAQRKGMPEELAMQMPVLKEVLDAMNIPRYELEGYEADDLLGTVSRKCEAAGWDCVVVTGDKDSLQLITPHTRVKLVSTRMGQTVTRDMTEESFRAEYGFEPIRMIDLKALMGDPSDNIPGVPGVGEKTAMELIRKYGSVDALYARMPDVEAKPAALKKLQEGEESARRSYWLATIVTDAPLPFDPAENLRRPPKPALYDVLLRLEFLKLIEKMGLRPGVPAAEAETETAVPAVRRLTTAAEADDALARWRKAERVAVLTLPELAGVAVCSGGAVSELFSDRYEGSWETFLGALFAGDIRKTVHNGKDLMRTLLEGGLPAEGFAFDTALAAYLLDATAGSYELSRLHAAYCGAELPKPLYLERDAFSLLGDAAAAEESFARYAAAEETLAAALAPRLEAWELHTLYYDVELPLCRVLAEMELAGCRVDGRALAAFGALLDAEAGKLEQDIYALAKHPFNLQSPRQLGEVLFGELGLPHGKKTKTGWSTNADVLESLRFQHPVVEEVLQYRTLAKLKSTYADGLLKAMSPDGRIRTSFQMTVTATGRLSSTEPNLQNIPTRTDIGSEIRRMFVAEPGNVLVDADYSQIELRLLAHIADDRTMQETFLRGEDIHAMTASQVFNTPLDRVTPLQRRNAKAVNFGIVYGISPFSLSRDIGVTVAEAKDYMEAYFTHFDGVRRYMTDVVARAKEQGYVETLLHRRRAVPELSSSNFNLRSFGERVALNMPIQGTAADVMKLAMVRVRDRMAAEKLRGRLILQVHDELIVECPEAEAETVERLLTEEMEGAMHLRVPLTAEAHSGRNWLEAKG